MKKNQVEELLDPVTEKEALYLAIKNLKDDIRCIGERIGCQESLSEYCHPTAIKELDQVIYNTLEVHFIPTQTLRTDVLEEFSTFLVSTVVKLRNELNSSCKNTSLLGEAPKQSTVKALIKLKTCEHLTAFVSTRKSYILFNDLVKSIKILCNNTYLLNIKELE